MMRLFVSLMMVCVMAGCARKEQLTPHDEKIVAELKGLLDGEFVRAFETCAERMTVGTGSVEDLCGQPEEVMGEAGYDLTLTYRYCMLRFQRGYEYPCWEVEDVLCRRDKLRAQLDLPVAQRTSKLTTGPWTAANPYGPSGDWMVTPQCYPPLRTK